MMPTTRHFNKRTDSVWLRIAPHSSIKVQVTEREKRNKTRKQQEKNIYLRGDIRFRQFLTPLYLKMARFPSTYTVLMNC